MCGPTLRGVHNAGHLPFETVVVYPFHPFASQIVMVVGRIEHAGAHHLIIRKLDGSAFLLPAWMTAPEAGSIRIVAFPRLPVNRLIELRALVDRLVASSSGELVPTRGQSHEEIEATAAESIPANATLRQNAVAAARKGIGAAQSAVKGSGARSCGQDRRPSKRGSCR